MSHYYVILSAVKNLYGLGLTLKLVRRQAIFGLYSPFEWSSLPLDGSFKQRYVGFFIPLRPIQTCPEPSRRNDMARNLLFL